MLFLHFSVSLQDFEQEETEQIQGLDQFF